jgi:hypothetical protein
MGFALSLLYFVTYYLTPATMFGPLAPFRIELILAALVSLVSLPALRNSFILKSPQSLALLGLAIAVTVSVLIGVRWAGGAVQAFLAFIPNAFAYFLVCLHCKSRRGLKTIVLMLLLVCLFVIAHGTADLLRGVPTGAAPESGDAGSASQAQWNMEHPYLLVMNNDAGESLYRLRGLGEINDPNDFAQLTVCVIPLMFIFWRPRRMIENAVFVLLPVGILLFGVYLTHSRGAILAMMAVVLVAARRRIGTVPALVLAGGLFVAASALQVAGGREISTSSGSDRTSLWGEGMQMVKTHPLFGVGYGHFGDNSDVGLTAHNSIVVCVAELGFVGLYFWTLFLLPTLRDASAASSPTDATNGEPIVDEDGPIPLAGRNTEKLTNSEINTLGRLVVLSLTGFLVQGLFLSRAYVMTLFLLGGMAEVVYEMALQRKMVGPRMRLTRVMPYAGVMAVGLVMMMYIAVRILNRMH